MAKRGLFHRTDYSDPINRVLRYTIDGVVINGYEYSYDRMAKWIRKWDDPNHTIRTSYMYYNFYRRNLEELKHYKSDYGRTGYIVEGLRQCIQMFDIIQNKMEHGTKETKQFIYETKTLFFAFFDFCKPKPVETEDDWPDEIVTAEQIAKVFQKSKNKC